MHNSTPRAPTAHPDRSTQTHPIHYIATNGHDLVEAGLTLDWITQAASERCRQTGEDLALWLVTHEGGPWIVAVFRPAPAGRVVIQWL